MYAFEYHRPRSIDEAASLLGQLDDPSIIAGGQTLLQTLKQRLAQPSDLVDITAIPEMAGIRRDDGSIYVGAMTRHSEVARSPEVRSAIPGLAGLAESIGDPQVRNLGSIGGSIANNDPAADYPAGLLGLGATVHTSKRDIAADDFFLDLFETALEDGEIIRGVSFPIPERSAYYKFPQPASRFALVGVMVSQGSDGVRAAVTGAGACVFRAREVEQALDGRFAADALDGVRVPSTDLNHDIHGSPEYRAHLITVAAKRAVASLQ